MERSIGHGTDEIDLGYVISRLLSRWKFLLIALLIGATVAFVISKRMPKSYESRASIFVRQSSFASGIAANLPAGLSLKGGGDAGYLVSLLQSDTMARRAASELGLIKSPRFAKLKSPEDAAIFFIRSRLSVNQNPNGRIDIVARADSPYFAARIANLALDILATLVVSNSGRKAEFIERKLGETEGKLHEAEARLLRFQERNNVALIDEETKQLINQLQDVDTRLVASSMELEEVNASLKNAGELNSLVDLEVRKKSLESSRDYLTKQAAELQARLSAQPRIAVEYGRLQREIGVLDKTYGLLSEQYELASISKHGEDGDYEIIDRARPVMQAVGPKTKLNTALGGLFAFFVAAFLVINTRGVPRAKRKAGQG